MTASESNGSYREQLRAPLSWYLISILFGLGLGIIFLVVGPWQALAGLVGGSALSAWVVFSYGRITIRLADGSLHAGPAVLPLSALGEARALDAEQARALRTQDADPRAYLLLRSYVRTAVRVEVVDPRDPHPYLYLSSRHPQRLAATIAGATAGANAAAR
ncbi:DUF3093 domain-containing protein [Actinospica durhamensis]|uniref:DUF3093 domain-containing protein n=1 Tax=Actinospica durhamensis TaxID=1508375 RepID=A0A941ESH1_9ACTN|nr:DUF3093 domain-containing protein [Actinospica durhamensis]MBR7836226.1 DUF3093 domain-containing protein [Actinospica durhamensis]